MDANRLITPMPKPLDLTGKKFNKLTVISRAENNKHGCSMWKCVCECGNEITTKGFYLTKGLTKSCGCLKSENLTSRKFGKLTVLEELEERRNNFKIWKCVCDCGGYINVSTDSLKNGKTRSCGCLHKEANIKSGEKRFIDISGKRFGKLIAVKSVRNKKRDNYWVCRCDCGNITVVASSKLINKKTLSCGCYGREMRSINGKVNIKKAMDALNFIDGTLIEGIKPDKKLNSRNLSGYKGVRNKNGKYSAYITFKRKNYYLGTFEKIEDAIEARKIAEDKLFGEFLQWFYETFPDKKKL